MPGIRNLGTTRVYNPFSMPRSHSFGIRNPKTTMVYNNAFLSAVSCWGIRYLETTVFSFVVILNMGDQFTKKYKLRIRRRIRKSNFQSKRKQTHSNIRERDCFPKDYFMSCSRSAIIASFAWFEYLRTDASEMPSASAVFGPDHL